jgi:hypothetical protein
MLHEFNHSLDERLAGWKLPPSAWQSLQAERGKLAAAAPPEKLDALTQQGIVRAIDESFVDAFRLIMAIGATLAVASAIAAWVFIGGVARQVRST